MTATFADVRELNNFEIDSVFGGDLQSQECQSLGDASKWAFTAAIIAVAAASLTLNPFTAAAAIVALRAMARADAAYEAKCT